MADHLIIKDREGFQTLGLESFAAAPTMRPEAACLRLLSGTCQILNSETEEEVEVKTNFLKSPYEENTDNSLDFLDEYQEGLRCSDYNNHLAARRNTNRIFYQEIFDELAVSACAAEKRHGTISFLHTYRAYERISYAFPMAYAYKSNDYLGSFDSLKSWISESKKDSSISELGFFNKYLHAAYDQNQMSATIDIHLEGSIKIRESQFKLIRENILKWPTGYTTESTIENQTISVKFSEMHTLILTARNRYFHQTSGRSDNIKQKNIIDSELFFTALSRPMLNYIAVLLHDILVQDMERSS